MYGTVPSKAWRKGAAMTREVRGKIWDQVLETWRREMSTTKI